MYLDTKKATINDHFIKYANDKFQMRLTVGLAKRQLHLIAKTCELIKSADSNAQFTVKTLRIFQPDKEYTENILVEQVISSL